MVGVWQPTLHVSNATHESNLALISPFARPEQTRQTDLTRMKLPHVDRVEIPKAKVLQYLLSSTHRAGKGKAAFFTAFGFTASQWEDLASALQRHVQDNAVKLAEHTTFGTRFVIEGPLIAPDGWSLQVRSVWFIDEGSQTPRFVTAYPLKRRDE